MGLYPRKVSTFTEPHKYGVNVAITVIMGEMIDEIKNFIFLEKKLIVSTLRDYGDKAITCKSIPHAIEVITDMQNQVERVWVIGGSSVYKVFCIRCVQ